MIKEKFIPVNTPIITSKDALEVYKTVKSGWVSSSGLKINEFEKKLAQFTNRKFASCVSNGTAALEIAVKSLGINKNEGNNVGLWDTVISAKEFKSKPN